MTAVPAKFAVAAAVVALAAAQRTAVTIPPNAQLTRLLSVPSPDDESSRMLRVGDEEDDICHPITRWEHLPPLPEPKRCEMRMEASGGTVLVLALVAVFTGMTQGVALGPGKLTGAWWWLFFCLIYGEAACAIGCLLGIMWGDPGVVKRSEETCFPIPAEVAHRLRRGLSLEQMGNVTEDGRTYCIRCLLWRPGGLAGRSTVHHCGTCQRCVVDFDHHCGGQPGTVELPSAVSIAFVRVSCAASRCRATQFSGGASQERDGAATWASLKARHEPVYIEIAAQAH